MGALAVSVASPVKGYEKLIQFAFWNAATVIANLDDGGGIDLRVPITDRNLHIRATSRVANRIADHVLNRPAQHFESAFHQALRGVAEPDSAAEASRLKVTVR